MERTSKLQNAFDELRTDLLEEVTVIDTRIIKPAQDARDSIYPMKKVIKKRGDKKVERMSINASVLRLTTDMQLDFEKYQKRVDTGRQKTKRSERDNASLEKAETELTRAKEVRCHLVTCWLLPAYNWCRP